jgi:hypothetical protein
MGAHRCRQTHPSSHLLSTCRAPPLTAFCTVRPLAQVVYLSNTNQTPRIANQVISIPENVAQGYFVANFNASDLVCWGLCSA